jgi:hypothetical protein
MSVFEDARQVFYDQADAVWPEVSFMFDVSTIERFNWRDLVEKAERSLPGGLEVPYGVAQWSQASSEEWGLHNDVYGMIVSLWYVTGTRAADGSRKETRDVYSELEGRFDAMKTALYAYAGSGLGAVLSATYDLSDGNAANRFYLGSNLPFYAIQCMFQVTYGEPHA